MNTYFRYGLLVTLFFSVSVCLFGQEILNGRIIDSSSKAPVAFVNISIVGTRTGTSTDAEGHFKLSISKASLKRSISISCIGYKTVVISIQSLRGMSNSQTIELQQDATLLSTVFVESIKMQKETIGNSLENAGHSISFRTDNVGNEIGILVKSNKAIGYPIYINKLRFDIVKNTYDSVKFKLNLYEYRKGRPGQKLLKNEVILFSDVSVGTVEFYLTEFNIKVDCDSILTIEWMEDLGPGKLHFGSLGQSKKPIFWKYANGDWDKYYFHIAMNLTIDHECK